MERTRNSISGECLQIFKNSAWLLLERGFTLLATAIIGIWMARYLGPEQFGLFSYALALVSLFLPLAQCGLEEIAVREVVKEPEAEGEILGSAAVINLLGSMALVALAMATQYILAPLDTSTLLLVAILSLGFMFQALESPDYVFQARLQSRISALARNTATGLGTALKAGVMLSGGSVALLAAASSLQRGCTGALILLGYKRSGGRPASWRCTGGRMLGLLSQSWIHLLQAFAILSFLRIDQVMLQEMKGPQAVGTYAVAVRLTEVWYTVPHVLGISLFPGIIERVRAGRHVLLPYMQTIYALLIWTALLAAGTVTLFSREIVDLLFGAAYHDAAPILSLQIWSGVMIFFIVARQKLLTAENKLLLGLCIDVGVFAINIPLNLLLIPGYGGLGASMASLGAMAAAQVLACFFSPTIRTSLWMFAKALAAPLRLVTRNARSRP